MDIDSLIDDLNIKNTICHKALHNGKCNTYCQFSKGHDLSSYVDIDEGNISRIPCRFLMKDSGCIACINNFQLKNWRTGENTKYTSSRIYENCRHNHFYKY